MEHLSIYKYFSSNVKQQGRIFIRPFFCWILFWPVSGLTNETKLLFSIDSLSISESTSIYSISGKWNDTVDKGDEALSVSRVTFGMQNSQYSLALIKRYDIYYEYTNDTVELLYNTENQLSLPLGRTYPLKIEVNNSSSTGLWFEYLWRLNQNWVIKPGVSVLRPESLQAGLLAGQAVVLAAGDYDYSFTSDLVYDEDPLYDRQTETINGEGYSVDLGIDFDSGKGWQAQFQFLDLIGQINIPDAPHTIAEATSDTKRFDENGYVIYDPTIRGRESNDDVVYKFKRQTHINLIYQLDEKSDLSIQHHQIGRFSYQQLDWIRDFEESELSLQLIPELESFGVNYRSENFSFGLLTDNFDRRKMKVFKLNILLSYGF